MNILFARRITTSLIPKISHKISIARAPMQFTNYVKSSYLNHIRNFLTIKKMIGFAFVYYCAEHVYRNIFLNTKKITTVAANAFPPTS